jgi:hypothetical protein
MGLNRLMLVKKTVVSGGDNVFIMTMGQKGVNMDTIATMATMARLQVMLHMTVEQ